MPSLSMTHISPSTPAGLFEVRVDRRRAPAFYVERLCDLVLAHTDLYPSIELIREGVVVSTSPETPRIHPFGGNVRWCRRVPRPRVTAGRCSICLARVRPHLSRVWRRRPNAIEIGRIIRRRKHSPVIAMPDNGCISPRLLELMDDLQRRLGVDPLSRP